MGTHSGRYAMTLSVIESDAFESMEKVAKLHLEGHSPYAIARRLSIKVVEAKASIEQWQEIVANDMDSRDAARDHLNDMVKRYDTLLVELNANLDNLKTLEYDEKVSAQINTTIKSIADVDAKRVDLLQKAGLYDAGSLGDEIAVREQREALILSVLRNDLCPDCRKATMLKVKYLMENPDATSVVEGVVLSDEPSV